MSDQDLDNLKKAAALTAVEFVRDGMIIGPPGLAQRRST